MTFTEKVPRDVLFVQLSNFSFMYRHNAMNEIGTKTRPQKIEEAQ